MVHQVVLRVVAGLAVVDLVGLGRRGDLVRASRSARRAPGSIAAVKSRTTSGVSRAGSMVMKTWPTSTPRSASACGGQRVARQVGRADVGAEAVAEVDQRRPGDRLGVGDPLPVAVGQRERPADRRRAAGDVRRRGSRRRDRRRAPRIATKPPTARPTTTAAAARSAIDAGHGRADLPVAARGGLWHGAAGITRSRRRSNPFERRRGPLLCRGHGRAEPAPPRQRRAQRLGAAAHADPAALARGDRPVGRGAGRRRRPRHPDPARALRAGHRRLGGVQPGRDDASPPRTGG